jgi:hypothetical protein
MDELPKLKLIHGCSHDEFKSAYKRRLLKELSDMPAEYFEDVIQVMLNYIAECEEDTATNKIYYSLQDALFWWDSYDTE